MKDNLLNISIEEFSDIIWEYQISSNLDLRYDALSVGNVVHLDTLFNQTCERTCLSNMWKDTFSLPLLRKDRIIVNIKHTLRLWKVWMTNNMKYESYICRYVDPTTIQWNICIFRSRTWGDDDPDNSIHFPSVLFDMWIIYWWTF